MACVYAKTGIYSLETMTNPTHSEGLGGAGVLEIIDDHDGDTYRAVYAVSFAGVVYAFQKKSKRGIATPKTELDLINQRLKRGK